MSIPLRNLLGDAINRAGIGRQVVANQVVAEFDKICVELYGDDTCREISHVAYRDRVLEIKCRRSVVAQNLQFNKMRMVNELNHVFKKRIIDDIKITVI